MNVPFYAFLRGRSCAADRIKGIASACYERVAVSRRLSDGCVQSIKNEKKVEYNS